MRSLSRTFSLLALVFFVAAIPSFAASYTPFGPQTFVDKSTVTSGGWSLCFSGDMGNGFTTIASAISGCSGDLLMMAGGVTGLDTLDVLAWAPKADVMFETGENFDFITPHDANGSGWYYDPDFSWGFARQGDPVLLDTCDYGDYIIFGPGDDTSQFRECWHTRNGFIDSGWRVGDHAFLGESAYDTVDPSGFTRYLYTANSEQSAPEPSTLELMGLGAGLLAMFQMRRKQGI